MKRGLLAAAFLVTSAGFASADYVIIVANVGGATQQELNAQAAGMVGMVGMPGAGMRGGMAPGMGGSPSMGMQGGSPSMGMRGGSPSMGAQGGSPSMGFRGGSPSMGMQGGSPSMGAQGGSPSMGMRGGPPGMGGMQPGAGAMGAMGGMAGMAGMRGGMMGMMGMRGGMMGMMGGAPGSFDADDIPHFVIAVVEVKPMVQNMAKYFDQMEALQQGGMPVKVNLPERLGKSCQLLKNPSFGEMFIITEGKNKPIPTVSQRFKEEFDKVTKTTPSSKDYLYLARWALEHGLLDKFAEVMDKLAETDKTHPAALAYLKIKAELQRKPSDDASSAAWRSKLLPGYQVHETPHYLIVHNISNDNTGEITTHAEHLENTLRGFYYWFALKQQESKQALPSVPQQRQVVIVTNQKRDFDTLRQILTSGPVVVDGFFARRENAAVMTSQRQDDTYEALATFWKTYQDKGYHRSELLNSKSPIHLPKGAIPTSVKLEGMEGLGKIAEAQMLALMLKALEQEAELATISHDASRQLLFASGLLPRNVAVPEWILFGMGSFFETPLQSPWPTLAGPSPYYLPRWRELKNSGGLEKTRLQTLRKVVTDTYFRTVPPNGKEDTEVHRLHEAGLRKARTVAWSLTYFLAQQRLDGLRNYFTELSKMPRDLELDEKVLLGCFARAFGCVDANNKLDDAKLGDLANRWYAYMEDVRFDSEPIMKEIREKIAKKLKEAEEQAEKQRENNANNGQQGGFPGAPGGGFPGGSGGFGPGGPGGGFPGGSGGFGPGGPGGGNPRGPGGNPRGPGR